MGFPESASTITLTGTFPVPVGGTARTGRIVLTPSAVLVDRTQHAIYSGGGAVDLTEAGTFTIDLLCDDDPDVLPEGWRWHVDEQPAGGVRRTYWIELPSTLGPTVSLDEVAEISAPDGGSQTPPPTGGGTPTGPAGGALTGTYPNPDLAPATIASFDPAGAATAAQSAAAADATTKATAAQAAAATDATAKVTAHTNATDPHGDRAAATAALAAHVSATDPHGDRAAATAALAAHVSATDPHGDRAAAASALATHAADTTDVHGIADTSVLETTSGAQAKANAAQSAATTAAASDATAKVTAHTAATDPHGDRAAATSALAAHVAATDPHGDRAYADGKLAKTANLSDLPDPPTARTNLSLGGAATRNVGTTTGTVAAGDDSRLSDPRTPTAHAASHAAGGSDTVTPAAIGALSLASYGNAWVPSDHGFTAWAFDPASCTGSGTTLSAGFIYLVELILRQAATLTKVHAVLGASGSGLTAAQCLAGYYDTSGNRVGLTADQSTVWNSAGNKTMNLLASYSAPAGKLYAAYLFNGTTSPTFACGSTLGSAFTPGNANLSAGTYRFCRSASGQTSLPTSVTLSGFTPDANNLWSAAS